MHRNYSRENRVKVLPLTLALHGKNLDIPLSRSSWRQEYGKTQVH